MLSKLIQALTNFFSSLFGSKPSKPTTPSNPTINKPQSSGTSSTTTSQPSAPTSPSQPTQPSAPTPAPTVPNVAPPLPDIPQDASELQADTVIIVAHEMEEVVILPHEEDEDFDLSVLEEDEAEEQVIEEPVVEETAPEVVEETTEEVVPQRPARFLWCLDNGHGKQTAGKRSPVFDDETTQFFEYEFNRDIVARIIKGLEAEGIQYYNVVPEVDIDNFLQGRVNRANRKASDLPKIYLSIHANAGPAQSSKHWAADSIKGIETWFYHGSKKGQKLAATFQKHLLEQTGFKNRHLKSRPQKQFYVLRKTTMPSVLTENGFYNNKKEALELMKPSVRQKIADAHIAAIIELEENGF